MSPDNRSSCLNINSVVSKLNSKTPVDQSPSVCRLGEVCDEETEFKCGSGECISRHFVCSSLPECIDHSDEVR